MTLYKSNELSFIFLERFYPTFILAERGFSYDRSLVLRSGIRQDYSSQARWGEKARLQIALLKSNSLGALGGGCSMHFSNKENSRHANYQTLWLWSKAPWAREHPGWSRCRPITTNIQNECIVAWQMYRNQAGTASSDMSRGKILYQPHVKNE